jgi:hypothetical protein
MVPHGTRLTALAAAAGLALGPAGEASAQARSEMLVQVDHDLRAAAQCTASSLWTTPTIAGVRFVREGASHRCMVRVARRRARWNISGTAWTSHGEGLGALPRVGPATTCAGLRRQVERIVERGVALLQHPMADARTPAFTTSLAPSPSPITAPRPRTPLPPVPPDQATPRSGFRLLLGATTSLGSGGITGFGATLRVGGRFSSGLYLGVALDGLVIAEGGAFYLRTAYGAAAGADIGVELRAGPLTLVPHLTLGAEYSRSTTTVIVLPDGLVNEQEGLAFRAAPAVLLTVRIGPVLVGIEGHAITRMGGPLSDRGDPSIMFGAAALVGFRTGG